MLCLDDQCSYTLGKRVSCQNWIFQPPIDVGLCPNLTPLFTLDSFTLKAHVALIKKNYFLRNIFVFIMKDK